VLLTCPQVLDVRLPFDEVALLNNYLPYLKRSVNLDSLHVSKRAVSKQFQSQENVARFRIWCVYRHWCRGIYVGQGKLDVVNLVQIAVQFHRRTCVATICPLQIYLTTDSEAVKNAPHPVNIANVFPASPLTAFKVQPVV
jgi:hypothetical protein